MHRATLPAAPLQGLTAIKVSSLHASKGAANTALRGSLACRHSGEGFFFDGRWFSHAPQSLFFASRRLYALVREKRTGAERS